MEILVLFITAIVVLGAIFGVAGTVVWLGGWWVMQDQYWAWQTTTTRAVFIIATFIVSIFVAKLATLAFDD